VSHYTDAVPLPGYPRAGGTIGFIGRYDEPRKGMDVLIAAFDQTGDDSPGFAAAGGRARRGRGFLDGVPPVLRDRID